MSGVGRGPNDDARHRDTVPENGRKPYKAPKLVQLGEFRKLTRGGFPTIGDPFFGGDQDVHDPYS